jgi:hypothetical protein
MAVYKMIRTLAGPYRGAYLFFFFAADFLVFFTAFFFFAILG